MFVHRSNRTERLADALADVVKRPLASALSQEVIVVASQGLERWLAQELSLRVGIWANARFPFPRSFVDDLLALDATDTGEPTAYRRENLVWSIGALLPFVAKQEESLRTYLEGDIADVRRLGLARQLAHVFDQYPVYRPELVRAWERGAGRGFQPALWRALVDVHGPTHVAARASSFLEKPVPAGAPERISLFGISTLPPIYLSILAHLAKAREVHLFLLAPSSSSRARHPLATSLGRVGRDLDERLLETVPGATFHDDFVTPGDATTLAAIQSELVTDQESHGRGSANGRETDASIGIHSCHSATREVEVLRDQLLAAFAADPTLEPHDVIVMAPDIDAYAPLVEAVFGRDPGERGFIPFRISDRSTRVQNQTAQALVRLLGLSKSRMKASEVLDLLQLEPVRRRFGIDGDELPEARRLVREAGIRWGIDGAHRATFGQPGHGGHTWTFGLTRLLLGQAMTGADDTLFAGVLPIGDIGNDLIVLVGKLSEFANAVFSEAQALERARPMSEWPDALNGTLQRFISAGDAHAAELRATSLAIAALARRASAGGFTDQIHREALVPLLEEELDVERVTRNFATGGVTFSALLPMRSVPFRVVCLLGLSDEEFPRKNRSAGFDLVARKPLPGDRSARDEDRQLFLEALLSARDRLIIGYVGRAVHDNARFPPSVVVTELVDAIEAARARKAPAPPPKKRERAGQLAFGFAAGSSPAPAADRPTIVEHPLQPWSPRYFGADSDPRLMSYVEADARGARALAAREPERPRFHAAPLIGPTDDVVTVEELARFLENPSRALLQRRLGVNLDEEVLVVEDHDPVEVGPLGAYSLGARLLARAERGARLDDSKAWAQATGLLPEGAPGDVDLAPVVDTARAIASVVEHWRAGGRAPPTAVDLAFDKTTFVGVLHDVYPKAQVLAQFARVKPKNELSTWVRHLAFAAGTAERRATVLVGRPPEGDERVVVRLFEPLDAVDATRHLSTLLGFYRLGQKAPLCFFPQASRRFAEVSAEGGDRDPLDAARRAFLGDRKAPADADDSYVRRLFEGVDPFTANPVPFDDDGSLGLPGFVDLSHAIFAPLLASSRLISP